MTDHYNLERFVTAQDKGGTYVQALVELRHGRKTSHWMWFVFPQIAGLGHSTTARLYAISSLDEAAAYLRHGVLGPRLLESTAIVARTENRTAEQIFGHIDALKVALLDDPVPASGSRRTTVRPGDRPPLRGSPRRGYRRAHMKPTGSLGRNADCQPLRGLDVDGAVLIAALAAPLLVFQVGRSDLDVYRHGASVLLHASSLYRPSFAAGTVAGLPFTYPPFAAIVSLVLLPLPEILVTQLWAIATIVSLTWCIGVSFRGAIERVAAPNRLVWASLVGVALWTRPVFDHLGDGQVDILLMTLCVADVVTPQPRWPRGMLVGIAAADQLVPALFVPYFLITRQRRAAIVAACTFVFCEGLAYAGGPTDSHQHTGPDWSSPPSAPATPPATRTSLSGRCS